MDKGADRAIASVPHVCRQYHMWHMFALDNVDDDADARCCLFNFKYVGVVIELKGVCAMGCMRVP